MSASLPAAPGAQSSLANLEDVCAGRCLELLEDGQEEVFSHTEVELGRIEHHISEEC